MGLRGQASVGQAIAQSLVDHMKAQGVPDGAGVLQINGSPTDAAAGLIRDGIDAALPAALPPTPWIRWGDGPAVLLATLALGLAVIRRRTA